MLRILAKCKASVRKSLQGLDYFAAEGARAFEDLESLVHQLSELGLGKESDAINTQSLKTAKLCLNPLVTVVADIVLYSPLASRQKQCVKNTQQKFGLNLYFACKIPR